LGNNNEYRERKEGGRIDDVRLYNPLIRKKVYRERIKGFRPRNDVLIRERVEAIKDVSDVYEDIKDIQKSNFINSE